MRCARERLRAARQIFVAAEPDEDRGADEWNEAAHQRLPPKELTRIESPTPTSVRARSPSSGAPLKYHWDQLGTKRDHTRYNGTSSVKPDAAARRAGLARSCNAVCGRRRRSDR